MQGRMTHLVVKATILEKPCCSLAILFTLLQRWADVQTICMWG